MFSGFDATYYGLTGALTIILIYTMILGIRIRRRRTNHQFYRDGAFGISLAACGFAVAVIGGVYVNVISNNIHMSDVVYQQARFSFFLIGFSVIQYGLDALIISVPKSGELRDSRRLKSVRFSLWILFGIAVFISACYLFNSHTYTFTQRGTVTHAAQERVFFLPLFVTLIVGISTLPFVVAKCEHASLRRPLIWFWLFTILVAVGLLREATIIPSSTSPIIDLLLVFVPFTSGGFCLFMSAISLMHLSNGHG